MTHEASLEGKVEAKLRMISRLKEFGQSSVHTGPGAMHLTPVTLLILNPMRLRD